MDRSRIVIVVLLLSVIAWSGCSGVDDPVARRAAAESPTNAHVGGGDLVSTAGLQVFDDCGLLLDQLQKLGPNPVGPGGLGQGEPDGTMRGVTPAVDHAEKIAGGGSVEGTDYSGTNVQEPGVDEPDKIKTDGDTIFIARGGELVAVDADGSAGLLDRISISEDVHADGELVLVDDRILVLSDTWTDEKRTTTMTSVDVSDPTDLRITDVVVVEGQYTTARLIDGTVRVVVQSDVQIDWDMISETTINDWLPHRIDGGARERLLECGDVYVPQNYAGGGVMTVMTLPLTGSGPLTPTSTALAASPDTVYATSTSLYVATHAWQPTESDIDPGFSPPIEPSISTTDLHRFDISGETAVHVASGQVKGKVLDHALSEHENCIRVATTEGGRWSDDYLVDGSTVSTVTVLEQAGDRLVTVGSVGDLGRDGTVRSVRFVGDTAFVVTFGQTDPFYVIDLSDPTAPKVTGELKIPGYSGYLHPIDATHILGVGQEGDAEGTITGAKVSLFDVSDPANPIEAAKWTLPGGTQTVEIDARNFVYWPESGLAVVPVQLWDFPDLTVTEGFSSGFAGVVGLTVGNDSLTEVGRISHPDTVAVAPDCDGPYGCEGMQAGLQTPIQRSIVVGDQLWTLNALGLSTSNLETFADTTFISLD